MEEVLWQKQWSQTRTINLFRSSKDASSKYNGKTAIYSNIKLINSYYYAQVDKGNLLRMQPSLPLNSSWKKQSLKIIDFWLWLRFVACSKRLKANEKDLLSYWVCCSMFRSISIFLSPIIGKLSVDSLRKNSNLSKGSLFSNPLQSKCSQRESQSF